MLSLLVTSLAFIKSEFSSYLYQILILLKKLSTLMFSSRKMKLRTIRNVRKELYSPLIEASRNHIALQIPEQFLAKRKKLLKVLPKISFKREDDASKPVLKEKTQAKTSEKEFFQSLPQEISSKPLEQRDAKKTLGNYNKSLGFLPSALTSLPQFHQLNEEFIAKFGDRIINQEFRERCLGRFGFPRENMSFMEIHETLSKRKCVEKRCCCVKGVSSRSLYSGYRKFGFRPTVLTPIIENVKYR